MNPLESLVKIFTRLPGIGKKSASRMALFLLREEEGVSQDLVKSLTALKEKVRFCKLCQNLTEEAVCSLCRDSQRNQSVLCILEGPEDLNSIERSGEYNGFYYLLHGAISPLEGIVPEKMKFEKLIRRIKEGNFREIILATNPNPEGEATALYLRKILAPLGIKMTRIASGVPVGGTLEYSDPQTLARSLSTRREF